MIALTREVVAQYFPSVVSWVIEIEKDILEKGELLSSKNRKDAETIGIQRIDDVRTIVLDDIPLPNDLGLRQLALKTELITDRTYGMSFGYGIVVKRGRFDHKLVAHELTHVMQYRIVYRRANRGAAAPLPDIGRATVVAHLGLPEGDGIVYRYLTAQVK